MDDLGPGGCGGFNSCDCCCAPQDLRATSTRVHTHVHSESRFKSKETNKKKNCGFPSQSGRNMASARHSRNNRQGLHNITQTDQ